MAKKRRRGSASVGGTEPSLQQRQVRAIYEALNAHDFDALEDLAYERFGFCSPDVRRRVWHCLLGLNPERALDSSWRELLAGIEQDGQIEKDVQRSVYSWDVHTGIRQSVRDKKRVHLSEVMHAVLNQHPGKLGYFQGFHEISLVFVEVGTPSQAFHMMERVALFHLSDQLCWPFDQGLTNVIKVLYFLLQLLDPEIAQALEEAECSSMHFAVPWLLTWFAHNFRRLEQVMRLFDCLLSSHPAMLMYFVVALLVEHKATLLQCEREEGAMMYTLQKIPFDSVDVDEWAAQARALAQRLPPKKLIARLPRLCRRVVPSTSPLFHYPHPWRLSAGVRSRADGEEDDVTDMSKLAPIYCEGTLAANGGMYGLQRWRFARNPLAVALPALVLALLPLMSKHYLSATWWPR